MSIAKRWIEIENDCFGPEKHLSNYWYMWLLITYCTLIVRDSGVSYVRQKKDCVELKSKTKKGLIRRLSNFVNRKDAVLLDEKATLKGQNEFCK